MTNVAIATDICTYAKEYYSSLFSLTGLAYYMPFLRKANRHRITGATKIIEDDYCAAPEDIEVSCQTDNILRNTGLTMGDGRLLKLRKLAFGLQYDDCSWACLNHVLSGSNNLNHADLDAIFNLDIANKIRAKYGYQFDKWIQNLMYDSVPDSNGKSITPADDGIVTVKFDDILSFEAQLRDTFTRYLYSNTYNSVGDVLIYGDSDLQALMANGLVMGQNAFGSCCLSTFASNVRYCAGSTGMDTFVYSVPCTSNKKHTFFKEDADYRYYFAVATGRLDFGYNGDFIQQKLRGEGDSVPIAAQFMERYVGCDFMSIYTDVLDYINNNSFFFLKRIMNPPYNQLITEQVDSGGMVTIGRRANSGVVLAVKKTMFTQFISNSNLTAGTLAASTPVVSTPTGNPVEYSKPSKNKA